MAAKPSEPLTAANAYLEQIGATQRAVLAKLEAERRKARPIDAVRLILTADTMMRGEGIGWPEPADSALTLATMTLAFELERQEGPGRP